MAAVLRMVAAVAVLVIPGAFAVLLAYFAARMVRRGWLDARSRSPQGVQLKDVLAGLSLRAVVAEARAVRMTLLPMF